MKGEEKERRWLRVLASCLVISSNGVQYALSQFMPYLVNDLGHKTMAGSISLLICSFTVGCIFHGCFLNKHTSSPKTAVLTTSPLVLALMLSARAAKFKVRWLMQLSFAITGFGIGPSYLSAIIHLQFWLPRSPALASSIGMAFGGLGSVFMAMMINYQIQEHGVKNAFHLLAFTLFALQTVGALFLKLPDLSQSHSKNLLPSHRSTIEDKIRFTKSKDTDAFKLGMGIELRIREFLFSQEFLLFYVSTFTAVGPGYALFSNLSLVLHRNLKMTHSQTAKWVVLVNLIATLAGRLPTGYIAEKYKSSRKSLFGLSGSRSLFMLYNCTQTLALMVIAVFPLTESWFSVFLILLLTCIFGGCNVLIAALSRELFAPINSSAVYGLILTATASSSLVFPNAMPSLHRLTGSDALYNIGAAVVSLCGAIGCLWLKPYSKAYGVSNALLEANM